MTSDSSCFSSFTVSSIQVLSQYRLCIASLKTPLSDGSQKVWVKIFNSPTGDANREAAILSELGSFSVNAVKYLHHTISGQKLFLFLQKCDRTLIDEITRRRRAGMYWSEVELFSNLKDLSKTLFRLHAMRLVHRNINPQTIFVLENKLLLGHFDDSKQVGLGLSVALETVRGTAGYFTPGTVMAMSQKKKMFSYSTSFKDDVWGLGRTLLDMATLRNNDHITDFFELPQEAFSAKIAQMISSQYSQRFVQLICTMLMLEDKARPSIIEVLEFLSDEINQCSRCNGVTNSGMWSCGHTFCSKCFRAYLRHLVCTGIRLLQCTCNAEIPKAFLDQVTEPQSRALLECIKTPMSRCECGQTCEKLRQSGERFGPYLAVCSTCKATYCSYCRAKKGHSFLGVLRSCPQFQTDIAE